MRRRGGGVLGGADHRFEHHPPRVLAADADLHGGVGERFEDHEDISGAGAGDGGGPIDRRFALDVELLAHRAEHGAGQFALFVAHARRGGPDGVAAPDLRGGVGHRADDGGVRQLVEDAPQRDAGENRDQQLRVVQQSAPERAEVLGFDREVDESRALDGLLDRVGDGEAELAAQALRALRLDFADAEVGAVSQAGDGQRADECLAHRPAADHRDAAQGHTIKRHAAQTFRSPNTARPMRTIVAPSSMATA